VITVKCIYENTIFDITLEKRHFIDTLQNNLKHFEEHELYEECAKINKSIEYLSKIK